MKRKKFLAVTLFFVLMQSIFAQKVSNIDFTDIKSKTQDSTSIYYYPFLVKRFQVNDTTLSMLDMKYIYYGNVYYASYNPYDGSENEEKFNELYKEKKYSEAVVYGLAAFKENPVNARLLYNMIVCYDKIEDRVTAQKYANRYFALLDAIYASGDGKSLKTAYVVIRVPDEYEILGDKELQITKQALVQDVDVLTINTKLQKPDKGEKKVKELYFNVRMPLLYLHEQFKKENE